MLFNWIRWSFYGFICLLALIFGTLLGIMQVSPFVKYHVQDFFGIGPANPFEGRDELFILLLGCDENRAPRGKVLNQWARTDSIHLVRLDFKNKAIGMMQIPRDTVVEVPGYRRMRINGLHVLAGPEATAQGVEILTGIRPERVIVLNYSAIKQLVDTVGGVEVFIEKRMKYRDRAGELDIDFKPGRVLLDGQHAVAYLRYRNDDDFRRGRRQQEFLINFKHKLMTQPEKIAEIANQILKIVSTSFTENEIHHLSKFISGIPSNRFKHGVLPVQDAGGYDLKPISSKLDDALVESGLKTPSSRTVSFR